MRPEITTVGPLKLIGMRIRTTLAENRTAELWRAFMPRKGEIGPSLANNLLYSVEIYERGLDPQNFNEATAFEKWAAVAVTDFGRIPEGLESITLAGGEYAVFVHRGTWAEFSRTSRYIFGDWLPASGYQLDDREHFEVMGEKYFGPADPNSEEEIWVPIKKRE
jgi:AraC family transcriptional regulator